MAYDSARGLINGANLVGGLLQQGRETQDYVTGMFDRAAQRKAGAAIARGDNQTAAGLLGARGDLKNADLLRGRAVDQNVLQAVDAGNFSRAKEESAAAGDSQLYSAAQGAEVQDRKERVAWLGNAADALLQVRDPAQRGQAFQTLVPALKAMGMSDEDVAKVSDQMLTDEGLNAFKVSLGQAAKKAEQYTLGPGAKRFDETGKLIAEAPFAPKYEKVGENQTLVEVNAGNGAAPGGDSATPRNMRNNNPGNIEDGDFARSLPGYAGTDGRFAKFDTAEAGQKAQVALLGSYGRRGIDTVEGIINRWAPPSDNNPTSAYVNFVAKKVGVRPDQKLDMKDQATLSDIAGAIQQFEGGGQSASNGGGARVVARGAEKAKPRPMTAAERKEWGIPEGVPAVLKADGTPDVISLPGGTAAPRKAEADLRKEFNARPEVKEFRDVSNSYRTIQNLGRQATAAGDMSMIFAYMKMLDPGSVVREGEFANAEKAGGLIDRATINAYNKARDGTRLNDKQRADFIRQAQTIFDTRKARFDTISGEYRGYAEDYDLNPDRVVSGGQAASAPRPISGASTAQEQARSQYQNSGAKVGTNKNPYVPTTAAQFDKLPVGSWFLNPKDGQLLQKAR